MQYRTHTLFRWMGQEMGGLKRFERGIFLDNPTMPAPLMYGEHITRRHYMQYNRYHLVMSIGHRKTPSIHVLARCDYNRTPVKF